MNGAKPLAVNRAVPVGTSKARNCACVLGKRRLWSPSSSLSFPWYDLDETHCLEVVFLLLPFSFPFYFSSSQVSLSPPGCPCVGQDLHSPAVHPRAVTPGTVPSPRLPLCPFHSCLPCIPFWRGFLLIAIPGQAVCFSPQEAWEQFSQEARGRSKVTSDLQAEGLVCR